MFYFVLDTFEKSKTIENQKRLPYIYIKHFYTINLCNNCLYFKSYI